MRRAAELAWVEQHLDDVLSDLSAIHRIDDPLGLPADRFYLLAERLPAYDGAVRISLALEQQDAGADDLTSFGQGVNAQPPTTDVATLAAMSDHPGFPGIEYVGG